MKFLFLSFSLFLGSNSFAAKICYFSLNNTKEFTQMEKFTKKLNVHSDEKIEIQEFMSKNGNPEESFDEMVNSGVKCDGLVISGHHTGSFGGSNANGSLGIDFMEKLSCKQKNKKFFNSIKALWLQGCRTLGVEKIEAYESADYHTTRVGDVLREDHLEQSFADLNTEFSATLDQDNPLSSRYLRVFPRATTFGWTKTAPGERSRSEYSIPYHIANMAKLNDDRGKYFDNPVGSQISKESAIKYILAVEKILGKTLRGPKAGCTEKQDDTNSVTSWIRQGNAAKGYKYAYNNPDLNAYKSLFSSDDEFLKKAKELECFLKNSNNDDEIINALDEILSNESLVGYSFNSIFELMQRFKRQGNVAGLVELQDKLKESEILNNFLMKKLASKELGVLRKIDYYAFWNKMTGVKNKAIEDKNKAVFLQVLLTPDHGDYSRLDFKETLIQSMAKHEFIDASLLNKVIHSPKVGASILGQMASVIGSSAQRIEGSAQMLTVIMDSNQASSSTLSKVAEAIGESSVPIKGAANMLRKIMASPKADDYTFYYVAGAIGNSVEPIEGAGEILAKIALSAGADEFNLSQVAQAIGRSSVAINGATEILTAIMASPKADATTLSRVAEGISNESVSNKSSSKILKKIIESEKSDEYSLYQVARAIRNSKATIDGSADMLQAILNSDKADSSSLYQVAGAISSSAQPVEGAGKLLKAIVSSPKVDGNGLYLSAVAISQSSVSVEGSSDILEKIVNSPKSNRSARNQVVVAIRNASIKVDRPAILLKKIINSPTASGSTIYQVLTTIKDTPILISGAEEVLDAVISSPKTSNNTLSLTKYFLGKSDDILNKDELIKKVEQRLAK